MSKFDGDFSQEHSPEDHTVRFSDGRETYSDIVMSWDPEASNCAGAMRGFDCGIRI